MRYDIHNGLEVWDLGWGLDVKVKRGIGKGGDDAHPQSDDGILRGLQSFSEDYASTCAGELLLRFSQSKHSTKCGNCTRIVLGGDVCQDINIFPDVPVPRCSFEANVYEKLVIRLHWGYLTTPANSRPRHQPNAQIDTLTKLHIKSYKNSPETKKGGDMRSWHAKLWRDQNLWGGRRARKRERRRRVEPV